MEGSMRRLAEIEKRITQLEGQNPFRLRLFIRITIAPGHDIFDRAEAGSEYFVREEGESYRQFCDRIKQSTEANPIWMFPQSHEPAFIAQRARNTAQLQAPTKTAFKFEPGRDIPCPAPSPCRTE